MSDTTADDRLTADDINAYLAEHRNWGRWGHDDELGALNLITAEKSVLGEDGSTAPVSLLTYTTCIIID